MGRGYVESVAPPPEPSFMVKLNDDPVAWTTAQARDLLISLANAIEPGRRPPAAQLSMYGTLLEVAAHTAGVAGDRRGAADYLGEATCLLYSGIVIDDPL